jgi:hypothetical protein
MQAGTTVLTTIDAGDGGGDDGSPGAGEEGAGASAGTEGAAAAPPPAVPDHDAKQVELARRFEKQAQREQRVRRLETDYTSKSAAVEARERAAAAKETELAEKLALFDEDPVAYALKHGKDPTDIVRRSAKPMTEEEKRIAKLEKVQADRDAADAKRADDAQKEQAAQRKHATMRGFVREITPDECPHLTALYPADKVPGLVDEVLNGPRYNERGESVGTLLEAFKDEFGRNPTDVEVRRALEHHAANGARRQYEALKSIFEPSTSQQPPLVPPASVSTGGPSLSNQHAGQLVSKKAPGPKLSLEERRRQSLPGIKAELEAEPDGT